MSAHSLLMVGGSTFDEPYKTAASTEAEFARAGDTIGIAAGGRDMWGGTNEFATVYKDGGLAPGTAASTKVTRLDGSSPGPGPGWSRATTWPGGSAGYATIAVTPEHGCVFSTTATVTAGSTTSPRSAGSPRAPSMCGSAETATG